MLFIIGAVHLNLYAREQYSAIPTIGALFIVDVALAWSLALALVVWPARPVTLLGSLFSIGTLSAYIVSLYMPLFGFEEPGISYSGGVAIAAEVLAAMALGTLTWQHRRLPRSHDRVGVAPTRGPNAEEIGNERKTDMTHTFAITRWAGRSKAARRIARSLLRVDRVATALAVSTGLLLAACSTTSSPTHGSVTVIRSSNTSIGTVLSTGTGYTLYAFTLDTPTKSNCPSGACTAIWPPLITTGHPDLGPGIQSRLMTTIRRANGTLQLSYAGHPLYTFTADTHPGQVTGENLLQFGGRWYAVAPSGALVTSHR
jgi:predicted lipoprotein with Yx(FWY)xxD motif